MVVSSPTSTNIRSQSNPKRPPLLLSSSDNVANSLRPKSRNVSSRYLSTTSSSSSTSAASSSSNSSFFSPSSRRRCPSPLPATPAASNTGSVKRAQSVERRRGGGGGGEVSAAAKMLISSSRGLSVSFQGGAVKSSSVRRGTPERKLSSRVTPRTGGENVRGIVEQKQQPWPGRTRTPVSLLSRSVDLEGKNSTNGSGVKVVRALQESLDGGDCKGIRDRDGDENGSCVNGSSLGSESIVSDMDRESVSSECNSVSQDDSSDSYAGVGRSKGGGVRAIVVPSKIWNEVNSRSKRAPEPGGSPVGRSNLLKGTALPKLVAPKRLVMDTPLSSPRGFSSSLHGSLRPSSPNQMAASPAKVGSSVRPASPSKMGSSLRHASPSRVSSSLRPASSLHHASPAKVRSSTIQPALPAKVGSGSSKIRSASSAQLGSSTIRPASETKMGSSLRSASALPSTMGETSRSASPSKVGAAMRPATPSKVGASLRPASPSRVGTAIRPATPSKVGASLRPASPSRVGTAMRPTMPSKVGASLRPASPNKLGASLYSDRVFSSGGVGRMASPSRVRNAVPGACVNAATSVPSVLWFGADVRRVRGGDSRLEDAHLLRILHNRHLQWRFINARTEATMSIQKFNSERSLYNAWRTTMDLRETVCSKRKELQWLKMNLKLMSILKGQMLYLEEWTLMVKDHCNSLSGAIESIKASTLRVPLVSGAKADIRDMKDAICSAADVMHSMASSICSLLEKVEEVNLLVTEVASISLKEQSFHNECKGILLMLSAMQVKDCSLRAHLLQLKCAP